MTKQKFITYCQIGCLSLLSLAVFIALGYAALRISPIFLFGGIGAVGLGILILRTPFIGILLIAFFLPFERIGSVDIAGMTVRLSQVTALLTIVSVSLNLFAKRLVRLPSLPILAPLIGFFLISLFGLLNAPNTERSMMVFFFTVFTCSVALVVPFLMRTEQHLQRVLTFLFVSLAIVTFFGIYQFVGDLIGLPPELTGLRELYTKDILGFPRVQSTALEPLYFANYLLVPLSILTALFLMRNRSLGAVRLVGLLGLGAVNLVLTVARGGYIAFAVSLCILFVYHSFRLFTWRNFFYGTLALIVTIVIAIRFIGFGAISDQFFGHVTDLFSGASYSERVEMFTIAKRAWMDHPLVGIGPGSFGPYASHHPYVVPTHGWNIVNNEYLELLAENGLLGLIAMAIVFIIVIIRSIKALLRVRSPYLKAILSGAFAGFIGILVQYNTFSILYIVHIWFTIGLLIALQNLVFQEKRS